MDIKKRKILTEDEFLKMREYVLKSTYQEIKENIFPKYWCENFKLKELNIFWNTYIPIWTDYDLDYEKISKIMYLHKHINSNYWMLLFNIKWSINDAHINFMDYNWYLIIKMNNLKLSFILWLSFWDSIKHFLEVINELSLDNKSEIKYIISKYSNKENKKYNTKNLDFSEFKSFPIFDLEKWKVTFRDFANDLKHKDDLLTNLKYELIMKQAIKERNGIWIKTSMKDFNEFYYWCCINNLNEATNDLVDIVNLILGYLKKDSKLKNYFK